MLLSATTFLVLACACSRSPDASSLTVEYYRANAQARRDKVQECADAGGKLGQTQDCVTARAAARMEGEPQSAPERGP